MAKKRGVLPEDPSLDTQGQRIRRVINSRGVEHQWVAGRGGWSKSYFSQILSDHRGLTYGQLRKLAKAIGCHWTELIIDDGLTALTAKDLLSGQFSIDKFFEAPLDDRMRNWVMKSLQTLVDTIDAERPQLERRRAIEEARLKAQRLKEVKEAEKKYYNKSFKTLHQKQTEERLEYFDKLESEYGLDEA